MIIPKNMMFMGVVVVVVVFVAAAVVVAIIKTYLRMISLSYQHIDYTVDIGFSKHGRVVGIISAAAFLTNMTAKSSDINHNGIPGISTADPILQNISGWPSQN
jgi:CBS domain-containing protein